MAGKRTRSFRVLALDGGGIKGAFTAAFLAQIEETTGKRIVDHFDLIVGTSTGGILALGLGLGLGAAKIRDLYLTEGERIFPARLFRRWFVSWFWPKHSPAGLRGALQREFGDKNLGHSRTRLVIPAFNGDRGDITLFKTSHHERLRHDYKLEVIDVALATSAAPSFFPAHALPDGRTFVDGGVWANCPALVAVTEAICVCGKRGTDVDVLSIGTTDSAFAMRDGQKVGGKLQWFDVHALLMHAQKRAVLAQAELQTRHRELGDGLLRIDRVVPARRFSLDKAKYARVLAGLGVEEARHACEAVDARFLHTAAPAFVPFWPPAHVQVEGLVPEVSAKGSMS